MGTYFGNNFANIINGSDGGDDIYGFGGNDVLTGGKGDDSLLGAGGNDFLAGGQGADNLLGGSGNDTISYADSIGDVIIYLSWNGKHGGAFGDNAAGDYFEGIENVTGGQGSDNLYGDGAGNILTGGAGEDYLSGGAGNDQLIGGNDGDWMSGGDGADHFDGGEGNDRVSYDDSDAAVSVDLAFFTTKGGEADGDTLQGIEELSGSIFGDVLSGDQFENSFNGLAGNDTLFGRAGDDGLWGDDGNDVLEGGLDDDYLNGGEGIDTASYRYASEGVSIALEGDHVRYGEATGDQLVSIERLMGSEFNDVLGGSSDANRLNGRGGKDFVAGFAGGDQLLGGKGADTLLGGAGADTLEGNGGADAFCFLSVSEGGDSISAFIAGTDTLVFRSSDFGNLPAGVLDATHFIASNSGKAQTADQHFTYEIDTGILRYDENGSNAGGVIIIATLTGLPLLAATDVRIAEDFVPF